MGEQAIFTVIPAGRLPENGELKVTVFVTPRLDVTGLGNLGEFVPLAAFEAFSNWPRTVDGAAFTFDIEGYGAVEGFPLDNAVLPDKDLWELLFGRTLVGEAGFQHFEQAVVHSYPVDEVAGALTRLYQSVAVTSPTRFPPVTRGPLLQAQDELQLPAQLFREGSRREVVANYLTNLRVQSDGRTDANGVSLARFLDIDTVPPADRERVAFAAATAFYDRHADPLGPAATTAHAPEPVPPEFHSFVARCADYPELLRRLGLAFDVFVKDDPGIPESTTIRVRVDPAGGVLRGLLAPGEARPATIARHTERVWAPASRREDPDVRDGSLVIDRTAAFSIQQLDPDGSALKLANLLGTLRRTVADLTASANANNNAPSMTPDASSLPALKSAGILLSRRNRAAGLVGQFDRAADHEQNHAGNGDILLEVMDLTRGYRVDIQDLSIGSREWFSLHRREGVYETVTGNGEYASLPVQPGPDEAYLKAASTSSNEPVATADQYLHETVAGWDGWSLATPRPGRYQGDSESVPGDEAPEVAKTGFPLAVSFRPVRGSLPRLRYGRKYRVRVRAVDLAGGSIPADQLDETHERDVEGTYQRWEPVPSPAVVPLTEFTEGESLMRLVIRSTDAVSAPDYVALNRVTALRGHEPAGDLGIVYRERNERNLAAPISSLQLAEIHGMLDAALSGDPARIAEQFAVASKEAGSYLTLPGGRVVKHADPGAAPALTGLKSQTLTDGEYIVHNRHDLPLPYLPDPLARGLSFRALPGDLAAPGGPATRLVRWPGDPSTWHDRRPVLLRIEEGDAAPAFDEATRTLVVSLPKATLVTVQLSSFLDESDPWLLRVWNLIDQDQAPASAAQLDAVRQGLHWMITPFSELTLVHAVEKPLEKPAIVLGPVGIGRTAAETFAWLAGAVHTHAASTGRIDIDAAWADPVDDVLSAAPGEERKSAHVADFQLEASETDALIDRTAGPAGGPVGPRHQVRHEFGDTRHRYVRYTPTATTRFREYFPPEITNVPALVTSTGDSVTVDVPSSARPASPDVRYIVPTWEWKTERLPVDGRLAVRRVRTGGGLRVYLGRPWFSSGPDELLGVVVGLQPWLTWVGDTRAGVTGSLEAQALADTWATAVLEHAEAPVSARTPLTNQVVTLLAAQQVAAAVAAADRLAATPTAPVRRVRARTSEARFLALALSAVVKARRKELGLAIREIGVDALGPYLSLYRRTGPDGLKFTSVWGSDPVYESAPVASGPFIHQFPLRTAVGDAVSLAEVAGEQVAVIGHRPEFDLERRLWFCDVQIDAGDSYTPMVQLALSRYQPHAVAGEHLSTVVKADFIQLLPRREATFVATPDATAVVVTLAGPVGVPLHARSLPNVASRVSASRLVQAWLEKLPSGAASDLSWERVGASVTLPVTVTLAQLRRTRYDDVEWAGALPLPAERPAGERWRVRLTEYEKHVGDAPQTVFAENARGRFTWRIVYSDTVEFE